MNTAGGIVVFLHHGIGDLLLAIPLLRCLARQGDHGEDRKPSIRVVVKGATEAAVVNLARLGDRLRPSLLPRSGMIGFASQLRGQRLDLMLSPLSTGDWRMPLFARLIGARVSIGPEGRWSRLGFQKIVASPWFRNIHKVDYFLSYAEAAGFAVSESADSRIEVDNEFTLRAAEQIGGNPEEERWLVLAPGSGETEAHKRWPPVHFATLCNRLVDYADDIRIVLMGSPGERPLLEEISRRSRIEHPRLAIFAPARIEWALGALSVARCFVGNCAGPAHLAAAADTPIVGLYGPTNPAYTGPYSQDLRVVRLGMACSPCYHVKNIHGCGNPICMRRIEPDLVFRAVCDTLAGNPCPSPLWLPPTLAKSPSSEMPDSAPLEAARA